MNNDRAQKSGPAHDFRQLAAACKIPAIRALKRAGMAASTPFRWEVEGSTPKPGQVERLRLAVLELAEEAGTLPADRATELLNLRALPDSVIVQHAPPHSSVHDHHRQVLRKVISQLAELDSSMGSMGTSTAQ